MGSYTHALACTQLAEPLLHVSPAALSFPAVNFEVKVKHILLFTLCCRIRLCLYMTQREKQVKIQVNSHKIYFPLFYLHNKHVRQNLLPLIIKYLIIQNKKQKEL